MGLGSRGKEPSGKRFLLLFFFLPVLKALGFWGLGGFIGFRFLMVFNFNLGTL